MMNSTLKDEFKVPEVKVSQRSPRMNIVSPMQAPKLGVRRPKPTVKNIRRSYSPVNPRFSLGSPNISPILKFSPKNVGNVKNVANEAKPVKIVHPRTRTTSKDNSLLNENFTIASVLKSIKMEKYLELFMRQEIDYMVFLSLSRSDLVTIGIVDPNDQRILLESVVEFNKF